MVVPNPYVIPMPWKNLMLVFVGGLALWILPWLAWPRGAMSSGRDPLRKPPVFRYLRTIQGVDGSAWSPVLMPLPTADGFSKKAAVDVMSQKSPGLVLKPREREPLYLEMKAAAAPSLTGAGMASLESPGFEPDRLQPVVFSGGSAAKRPGFQIEIGNGLKARNFEAPGVRGMTIPEDGLTEISAMASVGIDRKGVVVHVLLEQPSGIAALDSAFVRGLRAGRGNWGEGPGEGHVRIVFWKHDQGEEEQHGD
jgi:hypothetical protein